MEIQLLNEPCPPWLPSATGTPPLYTALIAKLHWTSWRFVAHLHAEEQRGAQLRSYKNSMLLGWYLNHPCLATCGHSANLIVNTTYPLPITSQSLDLLGECSAMLLDRQSWVWAWKYSNQGNDIDGTVQPANTYGFVGPIEITYCTCSHRTFQNSIKPVRGPMHT